MVCRTELVSYLDAGFHWEGPVQRMGNSGRCGKSYRWKNSKSTQPSLIHGRLVGFDSTVFEKSTVGPPERRASPRDIEKNRRKT